MAKAKLTQADIDRRARLHPMYDQFMAQKAMPKREVMKLKAGTWIEVKWMDAPNAAMLLIEHPVPARGDVTLSCITFSGDDVYRQSVGHDQVVRVLGKVEPPALILGPKS